MRVFNFPQYYHDLPAAAAEARLTPEGKDPLQDRSMRNNKNRVEKMRINTATIFERLKSFTRLTMTTSSPKDTERTNV